ncbi:ATP-binding cassette transporter protein YOR1-like protein [Microdochium trichocladiopsis]|uniref:ATP-binding cassette transporter protein YOR1-like protein n=1 Tax=Microdochium trichocladiopsis TaxID=1682393 RepID=A0A9P8YBU6_9PEZI|nr:ATP-binding cassette transporter protein YOR1-like protein [Microdochium trichocladiopsis]KAH7033322.1 ATP-binding cassette transporter protein YOR1-like protein [Microdochium trichocladiopsis]
MAHDKSDEQPAASLADPITQVNAPVSPEPASPAPGSPSSSASDQVDDDSIDQDAEARKRAEPVEKQAAREEMFRTQSYATDTSALTRTTTRQLNVHPGSDKPWYKTPNPLRWGKVPPIPDERQVSREYTAGFWSKLTFQWMAPIMNVGYKRPLTQDDLWTVNPDRKAELMTERTRKAFEKHVAAGDKYPLLWALHESFFWEFWFGGLCQLVSSIFQVVSPFTLRFLIQFATQAWNAAQTGSPPPAIGPGIGLAFGVTLMQICQSLGINHFIYHGMMIGGQVRAVLISMVFEKSMVISGRARAGGKALTEAESAEDKDEKGKSTTAPASKASKGKAETGKKGVIGEGQGWGNGRVVNLMSVDTYRVDQASALFHMIWTSPIQCIITLALLLVNLSYSALAGFALLVLGVPALTQAIKSLFRRRARINKITDQRVGLTQEILQSVRFVKYFGWETAFMERLNTIRNSEIRAIQVLLAIRNAINAVSMSLPIYASMLTFVTYSKTNNALAPAQVFSSLALFNGLRMPLNLLPLVIGQVTDAWQSIQRIQEFLLAEELGDVAVHDPGNSHAVELNNASFTWERATTQDPTASPVPVGSDKNAAAAGKGPKAGKAANNAKPLKGPSTADESDTASTLVEEREPFKIQDLNLAVGRKELIAVIGSVGSGKTSLLAALAGDMRKTEGEIVLGASRAFCPQYAWIQNATLRENILFGKDMDRAWYKEVIKACALQQDLDMLPNGDATEIGERGITISGGQKQRLNIARAIYFDADIVLMDDPLSAVDAHVGRHIFDNAILGLLKDKCRILATHQLWVLNRVDRIVWMEGGKIQAVDTFDNLRANHAGFRQLMESTAVEKEEEKEDAAVEKPQSDDKPKAKKKRTPGLMQAEERAVASVPWSTYRAYVRASGTLLNAPMTLLVLILSQGANIVTSLWLSYWTSNKFGFEENIYIAGYVALGTIQCLLMFCFSIYLTMLGTRASRTLLGKAVQRTLRAPMSFFDTTPLGRITNRFSRDVDVMDNNLTDAMRMYFFTLAMIISVFALIIAFFHWFTVALVPLVIIFLLASSYYRSSAREVKRFESVLRSVVFAKFAEGLNGVASIRAYGLKDKFVDDLRVAIDEMNAAYYLTFSNQRWLSMRLDLIGNLLVFTTAILVVNSRFSVDPSIGGLVLSYILAIVQMIQFTVRQLAEVENGMNAVERILYYGNSLEEEAPEHTVEVRPSWPEKGEIVFDNVEMRYRAGLPLVLQGLTMHIKGGERIGIVGRTGAGKSSIMSTLFRLVEISGGHITIDGLDISTLGLHDLRSRLAIIPQDPTLFRGTVRSNLDPFNEHTDLALWSALRQSDLVPADANIDDKDPSRIHLDSQVEEDGLNFSLGQRQMMALARALVRGSQIIICDEATSSVDMETDEKIQATMATGFRGKTLLCIAHRLRTIIGYDRICVMDAGQIAEMDEPINLWKQGGIFRSMCDRSGIRAEDIMNASAALAVGAGDAAMTSGAVVDEEKQALEISEKQ